MKASKILLTLFVLLLLTAGCNKDRQNTTNPPGKDKEGYTETKTTTLESSAPPDEQVLRQDLPKTTEKLKSLTTSDNTTESDINVSKRLVVKTGTISIEIDNYDASEKKVYEIAKNLNGFIASSTASLNPSGKKSGSIVIKVPVDKYDKLIDDISAAGKVASKNINSNDVTEEYIDLESREKTQKELEQRLLKLLAEKTAKLTDVVEVEYKLSSVRQNIESIEGKMKYLSNQASYSTLTVSLYEPSLLETTSGGGFFYELGESVKRGLLGFTNILGVLITVIIALIPVIAIVLAVVWIILRIVRKKSRIKIQPAEK